MALWKKQSNANSIPKFANASFVATANTANVANGITYITSSNTGPNKGWLQVKSGTGGRTGRKFTEILVATKIQ